MNQESSSDIYTLPRVKQLATGKLLYSTDAQLCTDLQWWDAGGRCYMCIYIVGSLCCTTETDTTL